MSVHDSIAELVCGKHKDRYSEVRTALVVRCGIVQVLGAGCWRGDGAGGERERERVMMVTGGGE